MAGHGHGGHGHHPFVAPNLQDHGTVFPEISAQHCPKPVRPPHAAARLGVLMFAYGFAAMTVVLVLLSAFNHNMSWSHPNAFGVIGFLLAVACSAVGLFGCLVAVQSFTSRTALYIGSIVFVVLIGFELVGAVLRCIMWAI